MLERRNMASNFLKAINDAKISVTTNRDGTRRIGGNAHMDREENEPYRGGNSYRGRSRGRSRNRGHSGGGGIGRYNDRGRGRGRNNVTPYSRLLESDDGDDEDVSMGTGYQTGNRYTPYGGRRNSRRGYNNRGHRDFGNQRESFDSRWFKVIIPGGKKHERNWLITKLKNLITEPFECVEFHHMGDTACFFVDDKTVADALKSKSHRITCRDGSKLVILVKPSDPPRIRDRSGGSSSGGSSAPPPKVLDSETEQILTSCLAQRFTAETNSVNLSKLSEDSSLTSNNIQGNLNKPWLMSAFVEIIHKIRPELTGLDISGNRIRNLDVLRSIPDKLPQLQILSLKDNEIQSVEELERLVPIESLKHLLIEGNPFCSRYQGNPESLKRDVRSKLPKVEMLDGVQLPPPILFDLPSATSLPSVKENHIPNSEMQSRITQFLQQYFQVYDLDNRQGLLELYHDEATVSICVNSNVHSKEYGRERAQPLNEYFMTSRNLKRLRDKGKRASLIKHTKLTAVAFLNELPRTRHDLQSFALDVNMATTSFICFTVRGYFFEGDMRDVPRSFSRTFVLLIAPDKSMRIMNDQLHIRNPIRDPQQPSQAATVSSPEVTQQQSQGSLTDEQQELVKKFSEASKMNLHFSVQCLQQNDWDFKKAGDVFTNLQREGKIPPEAFVK